MDEAFHINVHLTKSETDYISASKTRIWPYLLRSCGWILKYNTSGSMNILNGFGLTVINNLAISIEGFLADLLIEHIYQYELDHIKEIQNLKIDTWKEKRKLYNKTFKKDIEHFSNYKSIEKLFFLRNNIAHGKSHVEFEKSNIQTGMKSKIESFDRSYQNVRDFLASKDIVQESQNMSNVGVLWTLPIANFFHRESLKFMEDVINQNESSHKLGISSELQSVITYKY